MTMRFQPPGRGNCVACRKRSYRSIAAAQRTANHWERKKQLRLRVYMCPVVPGTYHLTSQPEPAR